MDKQYTSYPYPRMNDFMMISAHNPNRNERERLDSVTQLVSTITLVAQSINSAYRRDTAEGDRLVACVIELSRGALAEMRAWPARGADNDATAMITHALNRAMGQCSGFSTMSTSQMSTSQMPAARMPASAEFASVSRNVEADVTALEALAEGRKLLQSLTLRELDMLRLITKGMSNKEIANTLHLTEGTVKGYVSHMLSKIGVADRTQAALFAVRHDV